MSRVPIPPRPPSSGRPPNGGAAAASLVKAEFTDHKETDGVGQRIVLYGPGGIGKTSLVATAPGPVAFFDLDDSLGLVRKQLPEEIRDTVLKVKNIATWQNMRDLLHSPGWDDVKTIVIDSATKAEELATAHVIATVPHEKGAKIERIEDYGWGKGYRHIYDAFLTLLGDLDQHARAGRNVVLICHDCTSTVPNPTGDDWIRYEPRLQNSDKASVRLRVKEWADHVLFLGYDVDVKDGKGKGQGSRTIYPNERPHCLAKSRILDGTLVLLRGAVELWNKLFGA